MQGLPITLNVATGSILVVGGGEQATQKIRLILASDAKITVVASRVSAEIEALAHSRTVIWRQKPFDPSDLDDRLAVFVGDERELAVIVSQAARARSIPVNVVDQPQLSTFQMPAIIDRSPISIAIATGGTAPALARALRTRIEAIIPARIGALACFIASVRTKIRDRDSETRRKLIDQLIDGPAADLVFAGDEIGAHRLADELIHGQTPTGSIHLVGAGPGDPDLLTLAALRALSSADVIFYDSLVSHAVLDRARRDAERRFVGKSRGNHSMSQAEIGQAMIDEAKSGRKVVRLKGGDPFIFGRGGEEMVAARAAGIPVVIVPGITAALGCAAAAGIPLTQREMAGAVTLTTGHRAKDGTPVDWAALAGADRTMVIYMGQDEATRLTKELIDASLSPNTPVALIENGTRPDMVVTTGPLSDLGNMAAAQSNGPCLIIIGEVVRLSHHWREPLAFALAAE